MESTEYVEELLRLFNLDKRARMGEIVEKYLDKTLQIKFQRVLLSHDSLKAEFVRLHEAFLKITKIYQVADENVQTGIFSGDQLGKFLFNQGVYALCRNDYLQAGRKFQESYKINKKNSLLLVYMGIILTVRKNYYAAGKYLSDAVTRNPDLDDAWFYMAENYFKAGDFRRALEHYEKARKLNPAYAEITLRMKEAREALMRKSHPSAGAKGSLLKRIVTYFRDAFAR